MPAYPRMTGQHDDACAGKLLMKRFYGENSVHVAEPQIHQDHVRTHGTGPEHPRRKRHFRPVDVTCRADDGSNSFDE